MQTRSAKLLPLVWLLAAVGCLQPRSTGGGSNPPPFQDCGDLIGGACCSDGRCSVTGSGCWEGTCCMLAGGKCGRTSHCCDGFECSKDGVCERAEGNGLVPIDGRCVNHAQCDPGFLCNPGTGECEANCDKLSPCATCAGHGTCVWCPNSSGGGACQPNGTECAGVIDSAAACEGGTAACEGGTCGSCAGEDGCVWCATGSGVGSCGKEGSLSCSSGELHKDAAMCPNTTDPCAGADGCVACADADKKCGWCDSTDTCMLGDSSAPDSGQCGDWDWRESQCSKEERCAQYDDDCDECTDASDVDCGWCDDSSKRGCKPRDGTRPASGSCSEWSDRSSECGGSNCSAVRGGCTGCQDKTGCGWCESAGCLAGDRDGPDLGGCSSRNWQWDRCVSDCEDYDDRCDECTDTPGCFYCARGSDRHRCVDDLSSVRCDRWYQEPEECRNL